LDSKQRKIRSLRGFFLYALEIMEKGKDYEILETNLQPFFWRKVKNTIQQNKKAALQEFLFGYDNGRGISYTSSSPHLQEMQDKIQNLQNQVYSLQQKVIQLEHNQNIVRQRNLNVLSEASKRPKIDFSTLEQGVAYTLEGKKGPYLPENHPKRSSAGLSEVKDSNVLLKHGASFDSEMSKIHFKTSERSKQ